MSKLDLQDLIYIPWLTRCIYVFIKLDIADIVNQNQHNVESLADLVNYCPDILSRLIAVYVSFGFLAWQDEYLVLTALSKQLLKHGDDHSYRDYFLLHQELYAPMWLTMDGHSHANNELFASVFGENFFDYLEHQPDMNLLYQAAMKQRYQATINFVLDSYHFKPADIVLDIGGGNGQLARAIVERYNAAGLVLELASVVATNQSPVNYIVGDMLTRIPTQNANILILSSVLHNWDDDHAKTILNNCFQALPEYGHLLVVEKFMDTSKVDDYQKLQDIHMMLLHNGKERTKQALLRLLTQSNFVVYDVIVDQLSGLCLLDVGKP